MEGGQRTASRADPPATPGQLGILYVVATPIGNLEDVTLRALRVLREVALVAAEDTRRTAKLLQHYQIPTRLISLHEHNERRRVDEVLKALANNRSVALVSDAGTPGIADPGALVVARARGAGFRVEPIPGPSAITAALSASGIGETGHTFVGFPPVAPASRRRWFAALQEAAGRTLVIFEAPHRIARTLKDLGSIFGERPIILMRELTKVHEEWMSGPAETLGLRLPPSPKGEFVVLIPPAELETPRVDSHSDHEITGIFGQLTDSGLERRAAVREAARRLAMSPRSVYAAIERHKNSGE